MKVMKMINVERVLMALGLLTALASVLYRFSDGFSAYGWPLAAFMWILNAWIKTERIQSLTKNK